MNYLDSMRERRRITAATKQLIRVKIAREDGCILGLFEGEEDQDFYYNLFTKHHKDFDLIPVICDGKGGVLAARKFVDKFYSSKKNVLYFIDKDHDDFLDRNFSRDDTFVTPFYSIEWYFCSEDLLLSMIFRYYRITKDDPIRMHITKKLREFHSEFLRRSSVIMKCVIAIRMLKIDPDLEGVGFHNFFEITGKNFKEKKIDCEKLLSKCGVNSALDRASFRSAFSATIKHNPRTWIRGKLALQFFCEFYSAVPSICRGQVKSNGKAVKSNVQIGKKNFLNLAIEFLVIPEEIGRFYEFGLSRAFSTK